MVKLNKIYTRTGDDGTTGLGDGLRRRKDDARVAAFGSIDEANAAIGLARVHLGAGDDAGLDDMLARIQNDLFDLGADLCVPENDEEKSGEALRIVEPQVEWLESEIDRLNEPLEPLKSFVLPGGSAAAAYLHLARTVARRAERDMTALASIDGELVNPVAIRYANRLSDLLFVAARVANDFGQSDVLWVPGQHRSR